MSTTTIKPDDGVAFLAALKESLNVAMQKAAEPAIKAALADIEQQMRAQLGQKLVGLIEVNMSMERRGTDLVITIRQALKP